MESSFWHQRWAENQIGFHQEKINSRLIRFWPQLDLLKGTMVFVPLCGKTLDMLWLVEEGFEVLGIELSESACEAFFQENGIPFERNRGDRFVEFTGEQIRLLAGDFFALTAMDLAGVTSFYDRAALVALPESMRQKYAQHMDAVLPPHCQGLCISMSYDEMKMKGPPFSVGEDEVRQLFESAFDVEVIAESSGPDIVGNLRQRGLDTLAEKVYHFVRRGN